MTDFCSLALFWRYLKIYDMQRTNFLCHSTCIMTYFKMLYNFCHYQINSLKMNNEHEICPQQHPCIGFLLIVFTRIKDIQVLGLNHYAYVT